MSTNASGIISFSSGAPLVAHGQSLDEREAGHYSIRGAEAIISLIRSRRYVNRLIVGHNDLGDEGCRCLFRFLCSEEGQQYDIEEISLNANGIGDEGLFAIAEYLQDNKRIRELFLQNNAFKGTPKVTASFVAALNSSRLGLLSLATNKDLSDTFLANFLSALHAPHLRELQLSVIGLTSVSGKTIANHLSLTRCRLHVLKCNGNSLGLRALKAITRAVRARNHSLQSLEFYANRLQDNGDSVSGSDASDGEDKDRSSGGANPLRTWEDCEAALRSALLCNTHLKREVNKQSIALLRSSRPLILRSKPHQMELESVLVQTRVDQQSPSLLPSVPEHKDSDHVRSFPFRCLPLELQHYTLSFLAPSLSPSQRIRVFEYASSVKTLPQLLPPLSTLETVQTFLLSSYNRMDGLESSDRLYGRERERQRFFGTVGCDTYELEPGEQARAARELYTLSLI